MKKLRRFDTTYAMVGTDSGAWVKYYDAVQALAARQDMLDVCTGERDRLQTCLEVADRMRAFLADYISQAAPTAADWVTEAKTVVALYDDTRKKTLGQE